MKVLLVLFLLAVLGTASSYKILCLMTMPATSHNIVTSAICKELARRGHTVVAYSSEAEKKKIPNYTENVIPGIRKKFDEIMTNINLFDIRNMPSWMNWVLMMTTGIDQNRIFLSEPKVKELINSDEKFDLVYGEIFLNEAIISGMSHRFNAPIVALSSSMPLSSMNYAVGNPAPSSYIPDSLLGLGTKMTICQRLGNFVYGLLVDISYRFYLLPRLDSIMREHFSPDYPPLDHLLKNVSLALVNHHYSLAYPRPSVPNMIEIGGFHVTPPQPLPQDLQKYLDDAKEGVVYFSLGSNLKSSMMPNEKRDAFLKAFSRLKEKVLWKWETEDLPGKPDNVKISKWLPQSDILAHPNVKLFITHGGLLSTIESVTRGVPMVGIPIFAEQPLNVKEAELAGFTKGLDYDRVTADSVYEAIVEVLDDSKYRENVKLKSALINDRPMSSMDTAMYWIEYVIRHKGAPHMRSAAQDLSWFSLYLLDVYAILLSMALVLSGITFLLCRACIRSICNKKTNYRVKSKKKRN